MKNFDESVDENKLKEVFSKYGELTSVKVAKSKEGDKSAGFGFVNFSRPEDAAKVDILPSFLISDSRLN